MKKILVSGLINIETTVAVGQFPVGYMPIDYHFWGIETTVSGVAYNVVCALKALGAEPRLLSVVGKDIYANVIAKELKERKISGDLYPLIRATPQSVVLYDEVGNRRICLDLKDVQEVSLPLENEKIRSALADIKLAVVCNINFSRGLLKMLKRVGICIATDVHMVDDMADSFNRDFMESADILFLSNEKIMGKEREFLDQLIDGFENRIIVIGMGDKGVLMYVRADNQISRYPAVRTRKIVNTVGAGDALFSSFLFFYDKTGNPYLSIENAIYFASYKIGEKGAAEGFLSEQKLISVKDVKNI